MIQRPTEENLDEPKEHEKQSREGMGRLLKSLQELCEQR